MTLQSIVPLLKEYICEPGQELKRGRPCIGERAMTSTESKKRHRVKKHGERVRHVAIFDCETDPFDNQSQTEIHPFLGVLYSDQFEPVVIWDDNYDNWKKRVVAAIEGLDDAYTIYAHNGGKFDFMFLVSELRGPIKFKGRGIMSARIGRHELRDSFHIIPEKLANWKKDDFDYTKLTKRNRHKMRDEIIRYCINDCKYLFQIVRKFLDDYGFKISIGQAAMAKLKENYHVEKLGEVVDGYFRQWFFGGRVECLVGRGHFQSSRFPDGYKLYDVNSMYPYVMATQRHPISSEFVNHTEGITDDTVFIKLECENHGAFVSRIDTGETSANVKHGVFFTTIWEYNVAKKYGLFERAKIIRCIDFRSRSDFSKFVVPLYAQRQLTKAMLQKLTPGTPEYDDCKKDDIFLKLILNNAYGKFAQNPRKFKDHYITGPDDEPEYHDDKERKENSWGDLPKFRNGTYAMWERPAPGFRFNNVATAASITGAARAVLLEAIQNSDDPIYCDTDSLICRNLRNTEIHKTDLGAWDIEKEIDEVLIAGKKTYAYKVKGLPEGDPRRIIVRSKGASLLFWNDVERMIDDIPYQWVSKGPTLTAHGRQQYMRRLLTATTPRMTDNLTYHERLRA